jgi:hypothetical protein
MGHTEMGCDTMYFVRLVPVSFPCLQGKMRIEFERQAPTFLKYLLPPSSGQHEDGV